MRYASKLQAQPQPCCPFAVSVSALDWVLFTGLTVERTALSMTSQSDEQKQPASNHTFLMLDIRIRNPTGVQTPNPGNSQLEKQVSSPDSERLAGDRAAQPVSRCMDTIILALIAGTRCTTLRGCSPRRAPRPCRPPATAASCGGTFGSWRSPQRR